MSVHIDEVEANVEPERAAQGTETAAAPPTGETDLYHLRMELGRIARRQARLYAD
jgi:hypothetical protein